jgi:hypothetical protein
LLPSGTGEGHQVVEGALRYADRERGMKQRQQMPHRRIEWAWHAGHCMLEIE